VTNPLTLAGPEFLIFYAGFAAVLLAVLWVVRLSVERGPIPRVDTTDPYLIAFLRGGPNEAIRVAAASLTDRGLLHADAAAGTLSVTRITGALRPIERALTKAFASPRQAAHLFTDRDVRAACRPYEERLTRAGLLPDASQRRARRMRLVVALALLGIVAMAKIAVALAAGRTNVGVLVVLTALVGFLAWRLTYTRRTPRGDVLLLDLRRLFARLRTRAVTPGPGRGTADIALLTAVFGVKALPRGRFDWLRRLRPRWTEPAWWKSSSSSSGTSCSSCGASWHGGASSCGGGSCAGACGGCGASGGV